MIYLDSAATSFYKPPEVAQAVYESFSFIGNAGRGAYSQTLIASRMIYDTREKLARLFNIMEPSRIAFTSGVTESLNMAVSGLIFPGDHVITTVCEHNSVLRPLYRRETEGMQLSILSADEKGHICYDDFEKCLRPETKAVVISHASNLTGNVLDLKRISAFTRKYKLLLIVDAAQTAGAIPIDIEDMGIDVLCFTGHKSLMGPQGTGGIYVREGVVFLPYKVGGSGIHSFDKIHPVDMPTALEAGTLNGHGIAGLNAALDFILRTGVSAIHQKEDALARKFAAEISAVPGVTIYGSVCDECRVPIVTINIGNMDSAMVADILCEDYEISVRSGAHCAPLMHQTFHTARQGAVRFSFSCYNTEEDVSAAVVAVREIAADYQ